MKKDPTEFRNRFAAWRNGEQVYEAGLPRFAGGTEGYKYVQAGKNNEWSRITDDEMSKAFQDLVVRPQSRGGNTTEGNWKRQWTPKYEKPLESVYPEFELLAGIRALTPGVSGLSRKQYLAARQIKLNPIQNKQEFNKILQNFGGKRKVRRDGYVYTKDGVTPDEYKYYGRRPNYKNPETDELSDYQLDYMLGDQVGRGAERTVYQDLRNDKRLLKITDGEADNVQITNTSDLLNYIDESLQINNLPEVPKISYEGFIKDGDRYLPIFSQQKVTPLKKVADPFQIFTKQYVLPNGKTPSGKLSAIRKMNPDAFSRIGYRPIPQSPGVYSVKGTGGYYNVTDLGQKNVGIDALGNLKIFDPLFE